MRIGIPREIKDGEYRVALTPAAVAQLKNVVVEPGAGTGVGFSDAAYQAAGAKLGDAWDCDLIVKVKEVLPPEYGKARRGQTICGFHQLTAEPEQLAAALKSGATYLVYHTVGESSGRYPILSPMSAIAGRLAVQVGAWCLQRQNGGSGVLLPGLDGVPAGKVVIIGAGTAGANALTVAHGLGATITVFARSDRRFGALRERFPSAQYRTGLDPKTVAEADLIIGAVFLPGQRSPKLLSRKMLASMRPGSALVDVGIDQGGIAETSRQTTHSDPIYVEEGVVHYCVPNMPAACARTASLALERAVLPYVQMLANGQMNADLNTGIQVSAGKVVHPKLAQNHRTMKRKAVAVVVEEDCIGCARCIDACPVDAIVGAQGYMHTVVEDWCIGCELCVPPCPVDCIDMVAPGGEWTSELKRAAGQRGRRRLERLAASEVRSHGAAERKSILAALLGRK